MLKEALMRSCTGSGIRRLVLGMLLVTGFAVRLHAGAGFDATLGPDGYRQSTLGLDVDLTRRLSLDASYSQFSSSGAAAAGRSYRLGMRLAIEKRFGASLGFSVSPESEGIRSSGWNLGGSYDGGGETVGWGAQLDVGGTVYGEHTQYVSFRGKRLAAETRWIELVQGSFSPSVYCTLSGRLTASAGFTRFSYDRDLEAFSDRLSSLENANLVSGGMSALVSGFPDRTVFAGASLDVRDDLSFSFDWARTAYALDQPAEDSAAFGVTCYPVPFLSLKAGYTLVTPWRNYYTLGLRWLW